MNSLLSFGGIEAVVFLVLLWLTALILFIAAFFETKAEVDIVRLIAKFLSSVGSFIMGWHIIAVEPHMHIDVHLSSCFYSLASAGYAIVFLRGKFGAWKAKR